MAQIVIYKQPNGVLAVFRPTSEALAAYGMDALAQVCVPSGAPYKIIDDSELPADRSQRHLWTCDDSDLTDGVGSEYENFNHLDQTDGAI